MNTNITPGPVPVDATTGFLRLTATAVLVMLLLAVSPPAQAVNIQSLFDDLCQYYVLDSDTCSAKTVIDCLVKSGGSMGGMQKCAADYDPKAQKFIDIYGAATKPDYVKLIELAGPVIACKLLPPGPPTDILCSAALKPIVSKAFGKAAQVYEAASNGDWLKLMYVVGDLTIACDLVPDFPGKEITCGDLVQILYEGGKLLKEGAAAGVDALEGGAQVLGDLATAGMKGLGLGTTGVAVQNIFYQNNAKPLLHERTLKRLTHTGGNLFLGFDTALMKSCTNYVAFSTQLEYAATVCKNKSQQLHNEASALANLVAVAPDAYFDNIQATASLLLATNFWSGSAEKFNVAIKQLPPAKWSAEGFQSLPSPFSAVLENCVANTKTAFPVPLAPTVTGPLTPQSLWGWVCHRAGIRLSWALVAEKERITKQVIPQLTTVGCVLAKSGDDSLKFDCSNHAALATCQVMFEAAMPNSRCRRSAAAESLKRAPLEHQKAPGIQLPESAEVSRREPAAQQVEAPSKGLVSAARIGKTPEPITVEAEALARFGAIQVSGGRADVQPMGGFGAGWSGDAHVFWNGGTIGATLDLLVDVPADGAWTVEIALTQAPDYGELAFEVDHHPVEPQFDGYAPRVAGPVTVVLGTFAMIHGPRPVSLKIVGRNPAASGWLVGIDRVVLKPASGH